MSRKPPVPLARLLEAVPGAQAPRGAGELEVRRIVADSREAGPGDLFVAVRGHRTDGHLFAGEAAGRGAVAVVAERDVAAAVAVPVVRVPDTRRALAELAAAWHGHPARRLQLVGITGSFGKTGTLHMLQSILQHAGIRTGVIGSDFIGVRVPGQLHEPLAHTTPAPLELHAALARIADGGAEVCTLEITSQGLVQERVHGLRLALGIFTCIAPLEHCDYHGTFREYVEAKARFFGHVAPGAPVVYPAGERVVRALVRGLDLVPVSCGAGSGAAVGVRRRRIAAERTRMLLDVRRPLPAVGGGRVEPVELPLELRLLGRMNARNAALAAIAGLCLGASPDAVRAGLAAVRPPPRRLQLEGLGAFRLLDDTATHPECLSALFEIVGGIRHRRLHLVAAIRGGRGEEFNRHYAGALAIWSRKRPPHSLVVTSSREAAGESDRVRPAERDAFLAQLREAGIPHVHRVRLDHAIRLALGRVRDGDLLVLLGTQGMHAGAELVRRWSGVAGGEAGAANAV